MKRRDFNRLCFGWLGAGYFSNALAAVPQRILVIGDSISAEYGIARGTGWVALLGKQLETEKKEWQVINASVSGDTSAGGLARLPLLLQQHQPQWVLIELGGNDALRGFPISTTENNLKQMIQAAQTQKAKVLLLGMEVPPNYGPEYTRNFKQMFVRLSQQQRIPLVPFLLKGVADGPDPTALFQEDRIHPKAQAHPIILGNVWSVLKKWL